MERGWLQPEAEVIILHCLGLTKTEFYSRLNEQATDSSVALTIEMAKKRADGMPLQYLTKSQQFLDHEYFVSKEVLIPRPETECLVLECLKWIESANLNSIYGLEVGVGSGCISIELLSNVEKLKMDATDISKEALAIAEKNSKQILREDAKRLYLKQVNDHDPVVPKQSMDGKKYDFIISNPPYVSKEDEIDLDVKTYEPSLALYPPGEDPNYFYKKIAESAKDSLSSKGMIFLEVPHQRAEEIKSIYEALSMSTRLVSDLTGKLRILMAGYSNG